MDGHINRGGEFEQRAAFVPVYALPKGTVGLAFTQTGIVVFGSVQDPGMPQGVTYQRLQHPDGVTALADVPSFDLFGGKVFAVGVFTDGSTHHYYDGVLVTKYGTNTAVVPGPFVRTFGRKLYYLSDANLIYSNLADPTNFDADSGTGTSTGAGFNDLSEEDYGSEDLVAIGRYQNYLAIFSDRTVQIRYVDPDPSLSKSIQALHNTGTISPRSVAQFGDNDLFYLDASGLRSLRARDASNAAVSTDIGSAIDVLLTQYVSESSPADVRDAIGIIEPRDGRFWLSVADTIFVFSYFPAAKVSAWTVYNPGFKVEDMIVYERRVYLRSGDQIYAYGGLGAALEYDDTSAVAWLPYLDAETPTETKTLQGVDLACRGSWRIEMGMEPCNLDASDKVGEVTETTFSASRIPAAHRATHFSLRCASQGVFDPNRPAVLGSAAITYATESDKASS